jgi:amidase
VKDVVLRAAAALAEAGYEIDETCPPHYEEAISLWRQFLVGDLTAVLDQLLPLIGRDGKTFVMTVNGTVSPPDRAMMSQIFLKMDGVAREWSEFLARHPLVLTPTWTKLPFEHGFDVATSEGILAAMELVRPVLPPSRASAPSPCPR